MSGSPQTSCIRICILARCPDPSRAQGSLSSLTGDGNSDAFHGHTPRRAFYVAESSGPFDQARLTNEETEARVGGGPPPGPHSAELAAPGSEAVLTDSRAQTSISTRTFATFRARSGPTASAGSPGGRLSPRTAPEPCFCPFHFAPTPRHLHTHHCPPREGRSSPRRGDRLAQSLLGESVKAVPLGSTNQPLRSAGRLLLNEERGGHGGSQRSSGARPR